MANIKPTVRDETSGLLRNIQAGETISSTYLDVVGGELITLTNDNAGAIVIGTPVYSDAAGGVDKAQGDAEGTSSVVGLVTNTTVATTDPASIRTSGIMTATTTQWDAVAGTTGGLAFNTRYFLSAETVGLLTATPPTTGFSVLVGIGLSATQMKLEISVPYKL
jgi:hypothetical protein